MQVGPKTVVSLTYELYVGSENDEFEIVEVAGEDAPMFFLYGMSGLPEEFEQKLEGLKANDSFDFVLDPQQGYGDFSEEDVAEFPLEMFKIEEGEIPDGLLEIGNFIPFNNEDDSKITGRVYEVTEEVVLIDFNHPLAGKTMKFNGQILSVREASEIEIEHGHVHGEGGVQH
jgi:FKBP-type peptidyl-prolyl cis-trans isomerase SlyD